MINFFTLVLILLTSYSSRAETNNCPPGQYFVKGHHRNGYVRSDGTEVRATMVKQHCKSLSREFEYLEPLWKNKLPIDWPHKTENSKAWTEDEKERIREALASIPDNLLSKKIGGFYRSSKSKDYPNPASSSYGIIVIYDTAFGPTRNLGQILGHEMAHQQYDDMSENDKQDYRRATGWDYQIDLGSEDRTYYYKGRKTGYVEDDGNSSPREDYANNIEYYIYNPDKLKKVTPQAFDWIKKKYGGSMQIRKAVK